MRKIKKKISMSVLYYEYDYNTQCHTDFITIHSLLYRLGYCEAIVSITLGYQKAHICCFFTIKA